MKQILGCCCYTIGPISALPPGPICVSQAQYRKFPIAKQNPLSVSECGIVQRAYIRIVDVARRGQSAIDENGAHPQFNQEARHPRNIRLKAPPLLQPPSPYNHLTIKCH